VMPSSEPPSECVHVLPAVLVLQLTPVCIYEPHKPEEQIVRIASGEGPWRQASCPVHLLLWHPALKLYLRCKAQQTGWLAG